MSIFEFTEKIAKVEKLYYRGLISLDDMQRSVNEIIADYVIGGGKDEN